MNKNNKNNKNKVYEVLYSEKNAVALAKFLAPKYHYIHWKWFDGIPDEGRIISCLKSLVREVEEHLSTGGLYADRKEDGEIYIGIEQQQKLISSDEEWEDWRKNLEKPERKYRMIRLR